MFENYWGRGRGFGRGFGRGMGRGYWSDERSGRMDSSQYGRLRGGRGRNRTNVCRHPELRRKRDRDD